MEDREVETRYISFLKILTKVHLRRLQTFRLMQGKPDFRIQEIFACGIRDTGHWNPESSFWNAESR